MPRLQQPVQMPCAAIPAHPSHPGFEPDFPHNAPRCSYLKPLGGPLTDGFWPDQLGLLNFVFIRLKPEYKGLLGRGEDWVSISFPLNAQSLVFVSFEPDRVRYRTFGWREACFSVQGSLPCLCNRSKAKACSKTFGLIYQ